MDPCFAEPGIFVALPLNIPMSFLSNPTARALLFAVWMPLSILTRPAEAATTESAGLSAPCWYRPDQLEAIDKLAPTIQVAGTYTGSGGGSGVACFPNDKAGLAEAEQARGAWTSGSPLPRNLIWKVESLQATDYAEHPDENLIEPSPAQDVQSYIRSVLSQYLSGYAPDMTKKIRNAMSQIRFADPNSQKFSVEPIHDTGAIRNVNVDSGSCALVQIAFRDFELQPDGTRIPVVHLDPDLYSRVGMKNRKIVPKDRFLNQAVLQMHEVLYLLGAEDLGQKTSQQARDLTIQTLSKDFYALVIQQLQRQATLLPQISAKVPGEQQVMMINLLYQHGFGLAPFPFVGEDQLSAQQKELMRAFLSFEQKQERYLLAPSRADVGAVPVQQGMTAMYHVNLAYLPTLRSKLNEPESFIFLAIEMVAAGTVQSFYQLFGTDSDSKNSFQDVCGVVRKNYRAFSSAYWMHSDPSYSGYQVQLYTNAKKYCDKHPTGL